MADIECHLAFIYWNPVQHRMVGLPDGIEVRVVDQDPVSPDDVLGRGLITGGQGQIHLAVDTGRETEVELFFEVLLEELRIDLETGALSSGDEEHAGRYLRLPARWESRNSYSTTYARGLLTRSAGDRIGDPDEPLIFSITFDCFLRLVYWNKLESAYRGLPAGIPIEAIDRGVLADRVLAWGALDDEGRVHLRLDPAHEHRPDLIFRYRVPDDLPAAIDLATNTLDPSGSPIPREWVTCSNYALEDPARRGYWDDFIGYRVGTPLHPYVFDVCGDAPKLRAGNVARPLIDGVDTLRRLEALIEAARDSIHIEMMLYYNDPLGRRITDLLIRKARQGVEVRLMFDVRTTRDSFRLYMLRRLWIGELIHLPDEERASQLAEIAGDEEAEKARGNTAAIRAALSATPNLRFIDTSFPYVQILPALPGDAPPAYQEFTASLPFFTIARIDHRKMIIVDGEAALLGGHNIGQEYLYDTPFDPLRDASEEEWVKWHDVMIEIHGPAVRDVQTLFRERWVVEGGDAFDLGPRELGVGTDPRHPYFPRFEESPGGVPVSILNTTPGARFQIHRDILGRLAHAERRILVQVPYFTSQEAWSCLEGAAERGVKVVCIFPDEHNDALEFLYAARLKYRDLLRAGVEVYEYQRHMTHAKVIIVDDVSIIGSANLNHAGFFNHYEVAAVVPDAGFTAALEADLFRKDLLHSRRIEERDIGVLTDISMVARLYVKGVVNTRF